MKAFTRIINQAAKDGLASKIWLYQSGHTMNCVVPTEHEDWLRNSKLHKGFKPAPDSNAPVQLIRSKDLSYSQRLDLAQLAKKKGISFFDQ